MVYDDLYKLVFELETNNFASWNDSYGFYEIILGNGILEKHINQDHTRMIFSDYIKIKNKSQENFNRIVSFGNFTSHNTAKIEAQKYKVDLVTIPVPLSNDSFGTNRCSCGDNEHLTSFECIFPRTTLFDLDVLVDFGIQESIVGIGEYLGLYFSLIDYHIKNNNKPDSDLICFVVNKFLEFTENFENDCDHDLLKRICVLLSLKCIIMRHNMNHEIGCGIDHSLARVFEKETKILHGKAVFLGCIISAILFPEWNKWGLNPTILIKSGKKINIISDLDIVFLSKINLKDLVEKAIKIRPERKTMLDSLTVSNIEQRQNELIKLQNGIY